jgi:hypothetical protein
LPRATWRGPALTSAIAIQDIPEGLAVVMALRAAGVGAGGADGGRVRPDGAPRRLFGAGIAGGLALAYPIGLGLAAGAMIFVVSHEVIPETHRNHQTPAPRADGRLCGDDVPGYGDGIVRAIPISEIGNWTIGGGAPILVSAPPAFLPGGGLNPGRQP